MRQSTGHHGLPNTASPPLQHAMRAHARHLGWPEERLAVVATALGRSAQRPAGRDGSQALLAAGARGQVGIVRRAASTRLSRHGTAWSPVREVCASPQCRLADRDGVSDAATPNGRLCLGMQGSVREGALHPLRGRVLAGVQHKAQRGALPLAIPAGLRRHEEGGGVTAPDRAVPHAMPWVFQPWLERRAASHGGRVWRDPERRLPRRQRHGETVWRSPTGAAVIAIVRPPASAGPWGYGRTRRQVHPGSRRSQPRRLPLSAWQVSVHDRSPASVTWETCARLQAIVAANDAASAHHQRRGGPRQGAARRQGLGSGGSGGHTMAGQDTGGTPSRCPSLRSQAHAPVCQRLPAAPVDPQGVAACLDAVAPVERALDAEALAPRQPQQAALERAPRSSVPRLA